jgi:hypothetical protein
MVGTTALGLSRRLRTRPIRNRPRTLRWGQVEHQPVATSSASAEPPQRAHSPRATPCRNNLERRHHLLKSVQDANPLWLRSPARIEAIFCCQFLALLLGALIEREIRASMRRAHTAHIPLYPELRACPSPSAERILAIFTDVTRHELHRNGQLVQTFEANLSPLQQQVLDLLSVPETAYTTT